MSLNSEQTLQAAFTDLLSGRRRGHVGVSYYIEQNPHRGLLPWSGPGIPASFFDPETGCVRRLAPTLGQLQLSSNVLVDFGPGAERSVQDRSLFIARAIKATRYIPVDLAQNFLATATEVFGVRAIDIEVEPVFDDFFSASFSLNEPIGFAFMGGSTISNLPIFQTHQFPWQSYSAYFRKLRSLLHPAGFFLLGWHSAADGYSALAPYVGAETRYFLETPLRVLTELGATGMTADVWGVESVWHPNARCVAHGVFAKKRVNVEFAGGSFQFQAGQRLEINPSYKIPRSTMRDLAKDADMRVVEEVNSGDYSLWLLGAGRR